MDKPATAKQLRYVADLAERLGIGFKIEDWSGRPYSVTRAEWEKWALGKKTHAYVEETVDRLKAELARRNPGMTPATEPASEKQIAFGKKLEKLKTGTVAFDWESASKADAWARIQALKNTGDDFGK